MAIKMKGQLSSPFILRAHLLLIFPLYMQDNFSLLSSILKLYWHSKLMHLSQSHFNLPHIILLYIWDQRTLVYYSHKLGRWGESNPLKHRLDSWELMASPTSKIPKLETLEYSFLHFLSSPSLFNTTWKCFSNNSSAPFSLSLCGLSGPYSEISCGDH